jgi:hypothetical protein
VGDVGAFDDVGGRAVSTNGRNTSRDLWGLCCRLVG